MEDLLDRGVPSGCVFMPSIAGILNPAGALLLSQGVILNLALLNDGFAPSTSMQTMQRFYGVSFRPPTLPEALADLAVIPSTQQVANHLKVSGLSVSALAEITQVERKTVYAWLEGRTEAHAANYDRIMKIHKLIGNDSTGQGGLRQFQRVWDRRNADGVSLKKLLIADILDEKAISSAMDSLRPTVLRAMALEHSRFIEAGERAAAETLTFFLQTGPGEI